MRIGIGRSVVVVMASALGFAGLVSSGCASTAGRPGSHRAGIGDSLSVGAVDGQYRRAGGRDGDNVFKQIDWPTPTEMRLGSGLPGPDYWQQQEPHGLLNYFKMIDGKRDIKYSNQYRPIAMAGIKSNPCFPHSGPLGETGGSLFHRLCNRCIIGIKFIRQKRQRQMHDTQ